MHSLKLLFFIIISAAVAAFAIANRESVTFSLFPLPYTLRMPLFLLGLACVALGAAISALVMLGSSFRHARELRRARQHILALENEIGGLKAERHIIPPAQEIRDPRLKRGIWS